ncbi:MAG: L-threonylcarbamoyladenylate synthase [Candidatus Caldarchaeum sp.]|nr:L-threonylcarbamoyladenylate synthase [Candidatus Caldarchaeum sp.]
MKRLDLIAEAVKAVLKGGVVVYPTDTVYGIGCDPFDTKAVQRVIEIKKREAKPMPVLLSNIDMLYAVAEPTSEEIEAAFKLWPGPVTILMKKSPKLPGIVTAGEETVGVRIPAHLIPLTIMERTGKPLVGTSANISGQPSATELDQIEPAVLSNADVAIDGGSTFFRAPSTVIRIHGDGFTVLREGAMNSESIAKRLRL